MINIQLQNPKNQKSYYTNHYQNNSQLVIKVKTILKPSKTYQKYEAEIILVDSTKTKGIILLNMFKDSLNSSLKVDDVLLTFSPLREINTALNPNEFDYRKFLKTKGIYRQLNLKNGAFIPIGQGKKTLKGYAFLLRSKIDQKLKKYHFFKSELAIMDAILLGQRQNIDKELFESYKNAGAIHILAVSGLHIGIVLLLLNFLFQPLEKLKNGKAIKLFLVILFLWIYAFIAGMSASVIRATTMFTAIAIGWISNRPSSVKNSLVVSFFILILIHPLFLFDAGFQLSYAAVFSIVIIQPVLTKLWNPKLKFVRYFWQLITVSFAAQLGVLPLSLYYFHQFPGLFFISSLVIIPFLGIIIGLGLLIIILSLIDLLPQFFADFYGFVISSMNRFIDIVSQQESFVFHDIFFSLLLLFSFYFLLMSVINFAVKSSVQKLSLILLSIVFVQITFIYEKTQTKKSNQFLVFHQVKNSIIAINNLNKITFYHQTDTTILNSNPVIRSYLLNHFSHQKSDFKLLKNILSYQNKIALVIDSSGIYTRINIIPETVILMQSPKINLDRMIHILHPKIIIADGSNYKTYTSRWEKTCKKENVVYHITSQKGAFVASISP